MCFRSFFLRAPACQGLAYQVCGRVLGLQVFETLGLVLGRGYAGLPWLRTSGFLGLGFRWGSWISEARVLGYIGQSARVGWDVRIEALQSSLGCYCIVCLLFISALQCAGFCSRVVGFRIQPLHGSERDDVLKGVSDLECTAL